MRISDWSSDVCSSDLCGQRRVGRRGDRHALLRPPFQHGLVHINNVNIVCAAALADQAGRQGGGHIAAANKGNREFLSHRAHLYGFHEWTRALFTLTFPAYYRYSHANVINTSYAYRRTSLDRNIVF